MKRAVEEIADSVHELVIDACLELFPREIQLFRVARIREKIIPQIIGGKTDIEVILVRPDHTAAALGELHVVNLHHAACHDCLRRLVTRAFEQGRPENAVMIDDILTDEMNDLAFTLGLPELFPVAAGRLRPLLRKRDIADWRINPDIDDQIVVTGELHAPVERPRHAPVVQTLFYPHRRVVLRIRRSLNRRQISV